MPTLRKMNQEDVATLYPMALRAFAEDEEKFGQTPPLLDAEKQTFRPSIKFGWTLEDDGVIVGGMFAVVLFGKGELGAIFIDPERQGKGYGRQAIALLEKQFPKAKKWWLEAPSWSEKNQRFYESLGYVKVGTTKEVADGLYGIKYEKTMK